jgi:hypothetical protein
MLRLCNSSDLYLSYSSVAEIDYDVAISVDFDLVLEFCISDDGDGVRQYRAEFQVQSNGQFPRHIHMIVYRKIRSQVVGVQRISASIMGPVDVVSFSLFILLVPPNRPASVG